ncbi:MAG: hypothetical protein FP813_12650 [Desulfurivibrio sp.]|nr:hypothetical protein [Desulfurivibrio sp.]
MPRLRQWKATLAVLGTILCLAGVFLFWGIKIRHNDFKTMLVAQQQHIHTLFELTTKQAFAS